MEPSRILNVRMIRMLVMQIWCRLRQDARLKHLMQPKIFADVTKWERIVDGRDVVQAINRMETSWKQQMIKGYRNDPVYHLAQDSSNTSQASKMQDYCMRNGLLYTITPWGEDTLYLPMRYGINRETLKELMISEIHNKGHHSADRNLWNWYAYIYWPEMRKDFRDFGRQCNQC